MSRAMQERARPRARSCRPRFPRDAKAPTVARFDNENASRWW